MEEMANASGGSDSADKTNRSVLGFLIVVINGATLAWPLLRKIMTGKHVEYYNMVLWVLSVPYDCYMKRCGGEKRAAQKLAEAREKQSSIHGSKNKHSVVADLVFNLGKL